MKKLIVLMTLALMSINTFANCSVRFADSSIEDNLLGKLEIQDLLFDKGYYYAYRGEEASLELKVSFEHTKPITCTMSEPSFFRDLGEALVDIADEIKNPGEKVVLEIKKDDASIKIEKEFRSFYLNERKKGARLVRKIFKRMPHCKDLKI